MASLMNYFNKLLPFATPGTPLIQDLAHLAAICTLLYFAPQIQERLQRPSEIGYQDQAQRQDTGEDHPPPENPHHPQPAEDNTNFQDGAGAGFNHREPAPANPQNPAEEDEEEAHEEGDEDGAPGPANRPQPHPDTIPPQRNVGAKKLKSLQRRDQRRAYHEIQRSQGEAQRAREAEGAEEREAALAAEKERRRVKEAEVKAREAREREAKRQRERGEWEAGVRRREEAVKLAREGLGREGKVSLWGVADQVGGDVDAEWVEKVLRAAGLVGAKGVEGGVLTVVTGRGWVVRVTEENMRVVYERAAREKVGDAEGKVSLERIGEILTARMDEKAS